jgi:nucleoside phosphorylase
MKFQLTELREQITDTQRKMLTAIWHHYYEHAQRISIYELHHRFGGKRIARPLLEQLGGSIVFEYQEQNGTTSYQVSFLGVLLTEEGERYEQLFVEYLTYVVACFAKDPGYSFVTSQEAVGAFHLSSEQSIILYRLIEMGQFWSHSMSFDAPNWRAGIPMDIEDLPDDLRAYVQERAMSRYDRAVPLPAIPRDTHLRNNENDTGREQPPRREKTLRAAPEAIKFQEHLPTIDVLLVTVTDVEARAVLDALQEEGNYTIYRLFIENNAYYDLGFIGGARTFMVQSEMGTVGPSGALLTVQEGIKALFPAAVVMVGIAFGVEPTKQRIGDILVSQQILIYELQRVGSGPAGELVIQSRGDRPQASPGMLARFRAGIHDWVGSRVRFGLILSGEKLIDNQDFRDQLRKLEPEAIGGEMEGAGLYASAQRNSVGWILVKAICDWADGQKHQNKSRRQRKAARNAANFTLHVLRQGGFSGSQAVSYEQLNPEVNTSGGTLSPDLQQPSKDTPHPQRSNGFFEAGNMKHGRQQHISSMLPDGNVLIAGGYYSEDTFMEVLSSAEIYNPNNKVAMFSNRMAARRYFAAATTLSNKAILITGGVGEHGETLDSAEIFNPTTNTFSSIGRMTTARHGHTTILLKNGKVLIAGGGADNRPRLDS